MKQLLKHTIRLLVVLLLPVTIISCGGGGGVNEAALSQATSADLTISLAKTPSWAGEPLPNGVEITVYLPAGATYVGVSGISGKDYTVTGATYTLATNSVKFIVYNPTITSGIAIGSVATVKCSMSSPLTETAFTSANNGFPFGNSTEFQVTATYSSSSTTWDVSGKYEPTMSVLLY